MQISQAFGAQPTVENAPAMVEQVETANERQFLNFETTKVQEVTLDQLSRTIKENRSDDNTPMHGIYHYQLIQQLIDMCNEAGYDTEVYDIFATNNRDKMTPGVTLNPELEETYGKRAVEAHTLRRIFANIRIKDFDDGETTTNMALAEFGKPLTMIVITGFDKETMLTIDQEIKPRNLSDLFRIADVVNANVVASIINRFYAMQVSRSFLSSTRNTKGGGSPLGSNITRVVTIDTKYNEYFEHQSYYDDLATYAKRCYSKLELLQASDIGGVYAFLYFTKHHSDDEIQGFFNRLCFTETDVHVINLLREILIKDKGSNHPMLPSQKSAYLTKAWNYYIKGKDVQVLYYNKNNEGTIDFI